MQARFHYAKCTGVAHVQGATCPICDNVKCRNESVERHRIDCSICKSRAKRSLIYANQITLLMSLDSDEAADFTNDTAAFSNKKNDLDVLRNALLANSATGAKSRLESLNSKTKYFSEALICTREYISTNTLSMLVSSLWDDSIVSPPKGKINVGSKEVDFKRDGFVHRQYCISTRGIDVFSHLLQTAAAVTNCKALLTDDAHFFKRLKKDTSEFNDMRTLSILKSMLFDARHSYLDYNYTLAAWRELNSAANFGYPQLKVEERKFLQGIVESIRHARNVPMTSPWANIITDDLPSKNPTKFKVKSEGIGKWKCFKNEARILETTETTETTVTATELTNQQVDEYDQTNLLHSDDE